MTKHRIRQWLDRQELDDLLYAKDYIEAKNGLALQLHAELLNPDPNYIANKMDEKKHNEMLSEGRTVHGIV